MIPNVTMLETVHAIRCGDLQRFTKDITYKGMAMLTHSPRWLCTVGFINFMSPWSRAPMEFLLVQCRGIPQLECGDIIMLGMELVGFEQCIHIHESIRSLSKSKD